MTRLASKTAIKAKAAGIAAEKVKGEPYANESTEQAIRRLKASADQALADADQTSTAREKEECLERAEKRYTEALTADASRSYSSDIARKSAILANRAHARLRLAGAYGVYRRPAKFAECVSDCDAALLIKPDYVKVLFRRGKAHLALASSPLATQGSTEQASELALAIADFTAVLVIEPSNTETLKWLEAAPKLSAEFNGQRLPETVRELNREMARLNGSVPATKPTSLTPADPRPAQKLAAQKRMQIVSVVVGLVAVGLALLLILYTTGAFDETSAPPLPSPPTPPSMKSAVRGYAHGHSAITRFQAQVAKFGAALVAFLTRAPSLIRLPTIRLPNVTLPHFTMPKLSLPTITLPTITLPTIRMPKVNVSLPQFTLPTVQLPKVELPPIPKPSIPTFTLPTMSLPNLTMPTMALPNVTLPTFHPTKALDAFYYPPHNHPAHDHPSHHHPSHHHPTNHAKDVDAKHHHPPHHHPPHHHHTDRHNA